MAQQLATNTFSGGMVLDMNDTLTTAEVTTKALNATIASFNGHEGTILNDAGNVNLNTSITEGFIPIGSVEFGGIIYIVSVNDDMCEIGSFPSPNYELDNGKLLNIYLPLHTLIDNNKYQTDKFGYTASTPVSVLAEPSFDGSVNLIINDGLHKPRLINTGFHVQADNTYTLVKRIGTNNTNVYEDEKIDLCTSLYRDYTLLSKIEFSKLTSGGKLKVGSYIFYAVSCDKDGNESDIICESGPIPVFLGEDGDPKSISGGLQDLESDKSIKFVVKNVDSVYSYVKFYYSRTTSGLDTSSSTLYYKIDQKYPVVESLCDITITGYEAYEQVDLSAINVLYFNSSSAKALALNQNMLFLGNVSQETKSDLHSELLKLSLYIIPQAVVDKSVEISPDYTINNSKSYYNSNFIYNYTGYHDNEYYRFGIVYILNDNSLTLVYDVVGVIGLDKDEVDAQSIYETGFYNKESLYNDYTCVENVEVNGHGSYGINNRGVCKFSNVITNIKLVIGVKFNFGIIDSSGVSLNTRLLNLGVKGYFFVRQNRIPTILAQGYTTNICETAYLPSITLQATKNNEVVGEVHNYESFVTTTFGNASYIKYDNYFPQSIGNNNGFLLRNSYSSRLFSLTDKAYCYFDKNADPEDAINAYWEFIGYDFASDLWLDLSSYSDYYGNSSEYLVLISTNSTGKIDSGYYYTDFYFFEKVKWEDYTKILGLDWENHFTELFQVTEDSTVDNITLSYVFDNNIDSAFKNYLVLNKLISSSDTKIESNNIPFFYVDDRYRYSMLKYFQCLSRITVGEFLSSNNLTYSKWNNWSKVRTEPMYGIYNGLLYMFYDMGPAYCEYYQSDYNSKAKKFFLNYSYSEDNPYNKILRPNAKSGSSVFDGISGGYKLTQPTYNGKFNYTSKTFENDLSKFEINPMEFNSYGIFCPEFELNQSYYNSVFTGTNFKYRYLTDKVYPSSSDGRLYKVSVSDYEVGDFKEANIIAVSEGVTLNNIHTDDDCASLYIDNEGNHYFSAIAGTAQEIGFKFAGPEFLCYTGFGNTLNKFSNDYPSNIVRGVYSAYLGTVPKQVTENGLTVNEDFGSRLVEICVKDADSENLIQYRYKDPSAYYPISDRIPISESATICYRGDCYINYYTHRVNRNFNDSTSPYNDTIIDLRTLKSNFSKLFNNDYRKFDLSKDSDAATNINLGDINAVLLGSWVTFPVRSSLNIALRSEDPTNTAEKLACGHNRSFYPRNGIDASGSNKIPDSTAYNKAFSKSTGDKMYFNLGDLIYSKYYYKNRILYSNVLLKDTITNGNRVFLSTHYRDYTDLYGEIVKLVSMASNLLCVCEHGVLLIPVNERALAGEGAGGSIYINTSNVLPENPVVVSDTYGSKWPDSVILTPYGVFGVDADSSKIWKTDGQTLSIISDFKIQSFLNKYLHVNNDVCIGTTNIKSHFNKVKNDILFTLYDTDNLWNLCYNINLQSWITFYSWIPVLSENIGDCFITTPLNEDKVGNLYKHGFSLRIPSDLPKPTYWYDEQHPFEFEFIVKDNPGYHKIFDNLLLISNNTPPESFHYDIVGDCYDFALDKPNIYVRQELTKLVLHNLFGSSILDNQIGITPVTLEKSTIFPMYYNRCENSVGYDTYKQLSPESGYNYDALSGTEVLYDPNLNEFHLCNHVKAVDIKGNGGTIRGNMTYREDIWKVQINPINLVQSNEKPWTKIPIVINNIKVNDATLLEADASKLPEGYTADDVVTWDISNRKEVRVKDKYIKIRIRYTGDKYALVTAVNTLYTISFA